jgi:hypothetical protein
MGGLAMIIMNFGSRYILGDLSQFHENVLKSEVAKKIILFCIFFVATRDILVAIMLTFAFYFVVFGILNEKKLYNIVGSFQESFVVTKAKYVKFVKSIS